MSPRRGRRRRTYRLSDEQMKHINGLRADHEGDCQRCPDRIVQGDRVVKRGDGYIHARCAPGGDE